MLLFEDKIAWEEKCGVSLFHPFRMSVRKSIAYYMLLVHAFFAHFLLIVYSISPQHIGQIHDAHVFI
mgnify:CR=1 FL=1